MALDRGMTSDQSLAVSDSLLERSSRGVICICSSRAMSALGNLDVGIKKTLNRVLGGALGSIWRLFERGRFVVLSLHCF